MADSTVASRQPVLHSPSEETPLALFQVPTRRLSRTFCVLFGLASMVSGLCNIAIKQLLLPAQVSLLDPTNTYTTLAIVASAGAAAGIITTPLVGALSDRTTSRWGRRRPWLVFGLIFVVLGLVLMARATTLAQLLMGEVIVQISVDSIMAVITAIIPDQVPLTQRALTSAFVGMAPVVGGLIGLLLVARFTNANLHPEQGYYIMAAAACVCVLLFLLVLRDRQLPRHIMPRFRLVPFLAEFWVSPRKHPDFLFTWLSRGLAFLGYTILVSYLYLYLKDVIHYPGADKGVAIFQALTTGTLIISAIIGSILSDRLQRIKPFVIGSALLMMSSLLVIVFIPVWSFMLIAAVLTGLGFGAYLAVDITLAVRVLPTEKNRAKDLGIINTAIFLALLFTPIVSAFILNTFHSYALLFAFAAGCFLLAALFIIPIKSVH
ncbi:MFS transporter [Ktedonobacter sp. SOSP1-52]|uniref:MFS transporter n=1 Tax=Ktedonobacter sp. SOSP1-52 TaxID=2778366 RepID=UPI001915C618|nr:MFS transporter [Ktedonobacter sp. SOSP1-52]GHO65483.1 MFS transporter [Ktedonobacter sp. SOSP1-52]